MAKSKLQQLLNSAVTTNPEELKNWIEKEINAKDQNQETVLHKASDGGNLPTVKYLIQLGAQIEAKDKNENTPLFEAVLNNEPEIASSSSDEETNVMSSSFPSASNKKLLDLDRFSVVRDSIR